MVKIWASAELEDKLASSGVNIVAGADEVGRGAWAGPMLVCCAVVGKNFNIGVCDSKMLKPAQRQDLYEQIKADILCYAVAKVSSEEIDELGLSLSLVLAYERALEKLPIAVSQVIIDGPINYLSDYNIGFAVKKADCLHRCVAAASIIAKVERDKIMSKYALMYPEYGFDTNVGYGTNKHRSTIKKLGITKIHRQSFNIYG